MNHIGGVMVMVPTVSAMVHGFESRLDKTKDYNIDMCCSSTKHTVSKSKMLRTCPARSVVVQ